MAAIKDTAAIADKWARVTPGRTQDYTDGVANPRRPWAQSTIAAKAAWADGVSQAITRDAFAKGIQSAGESKWQDNALSKGPGRWAEGVRLGKDNFSAGFEPFRAAIAGLQLPPRGPRGDERNLERVRAVVKALREVKERRT